MSEEESYEGDIKDLLTGIFIQMTRIYDVLSLLAPQEQMAKLSDLHESGRTLSPYPQMQENAFDEPD